MRPPREDHTGAWWHVMNRGIARRTVFETVQDVDAFLDHVESVTALGLLEVHAYTFLTTHFHLLVRSPRGRISDAMRRIENPYVRRFNRTRRRDGSLFRSRFCGRRIDDSDYWETVLRYIDLNAPRAGLCRLPSEHPYGSARYFRHGGGPEWLRREDVQRAVSDTCPGGIFDAARYDAYSMNCDPDAGAFLVERLLAHRATPSPPFDDLIRAARSRDLGWMRWKALLADGTPIGAAFLSPPEATRAAEVAIRVLARRRRTPTRSDVGRDLRCGLLARAAGLSATEVADALGIARSSVHMALRRHELRIDDNPAYEELIARVVRSALLRSRRRRLAARP